MKNILLVRHLESTKNLSLQFSAAESKESLTECAKKEGLALGKNIAEFVKLTNLKVKNIYSADSKRALETAGFISKSLEVPIVVNPNLRSSSMGIMQGKSEDEVRQSYPLFIKQLKLWEVGLYNSYEFEKFEGRESKESLENRVMNAVDNIFDIENEELKIIVLHTSSLNAVLINLARRFYNFPRDFWTSPVSNYGGIYWIELKEKNDEFSFKGLNISSEQLLKMVHSL